MVLVKRVLNADDRELLHEALVDVCQLVHVHPLALVGAGVLEVQVVLSFPVSTLFTVRVAELNNSIHVELRESNQRPIVQNKCKIPFKILQYFSQFTVGKQFCCGTMSILITDIAVNMNKDIKESSKKCDQYFFTCKHWSLPISYKHLKCSYKI